MSLLQAVETAMAMYREACETQHPSASAEEAGKAAVQLARLCDDLLKVCGHAQNQQSASFCLLTIVQTWQRFQYITSKI